MREGGRGSREGRARGGRSRKGGRGENFFPVRSQPRSPRQGCVGCLDSAMWRPFLASVRLCPREPRPSTKQRKVGQIGNF